MFIFSLMKIKTDIWWVWVYFENMCLIGQHVLHKVVSIHKSFWRLWLEMTELLQEVLKYK